MKLRMLITKVGSPDGVQVVPYHAGEKYDVPRELGEVLLREGWAEEDKEDVLEVKDELPPPKARGKRR